jgi:hypothetical protein
MPKMEKNYIRFAFPEIETMHSIISCLAENKFDPFIMIFYPDRHPHKFYKNEPYLSSKMDVQFKSPEELIRFVDLINQKAE